MRFVILYRNREDIRELVEQQIGQAIKQGFNFLTHALNSPLFQTRPFWPTQEETAAMPFLTQCEEVEWTGDKLVSIRKLIYEAEKVVPVESTKEAA